MVQVILNLIVNAAQSIERGTGTGTIEISTECRHRDVIIAVSDDGPGIELSIRNHLFEPFITTRRVGEGTGLGLYICYKYATECGGRIEVESEIDRGARFRVIMPAAAQTSSTREPEAERNLVVGPLPQLSMLLIDDEELVRRTLRTSLASRVAVTTAASAREARMLLQDPEKSYDAIVCDLFMPDESGPQLHAWLQENRPELLPRTGFITGGAFTEQARAFIEGIAPPCLQKPFSGEDLLAFVRKIHSASKG
jgi:CheY-like chemotaxis protein